MFTSISLSAEILAGYLVGFGEGVRLATWHILQLPGANLYGTGCTIHHNLVFQKDILRSMLSHIVALHNKSIVEVMHEAGNQLAMMPSEYDLYFTYALYNYRERMEIVQYPYIHARLPHLCTEKDAEAMLNETDIVAATCHDRYVTYPLTLTYRRYTKAILRKNCMYSWGERPDDHDVCVGSSNNCTFTTADCARNSATGKCLVTPEPMKCILPAVGLEKSLAAGEKIEMATHQHGHR